MAARPASDGWPALFTAAFRGSSNAMALVDERRCHVDVNGAYLRLLGHPRDRLVGRPVSEIVVGAPVFASEGWAAALDSGQFAGATDLSRADGTTVSVQWGAHVEVATGRRLVLFVALSTSRWGSRFRRTVDHDADPGRLSRREREIVRLVALGHSGREIADELLIAHETVRTHVRNAMAKAGARSRAHLVAKALAQGAIAV